ESGLMEMEPLVSSNRAPFLPKPSSDGVLEGRRVILSQFSPPPPRIGIRGAGHLLMVIYHWIKLVRKLDNLKSFIAINAHLMHLGSTADFDLVSDLLEVDPESKKAIEKRLRLGPIDLEALIKLPEETLGGAYARYIR